MKIKLSKSGEVLDLPADFSVEINRCNPFFNEYGEHSIPITLPPSDTNIRLLGFFDKGGIGAFHTSFQVSVEDGAFFYPATMKVLSANLKDGFDCSFLLNLGRLYSLVQADRLIDIVESEYVQVDYTTASAAMIALEKIATKEVLEDNAPYDIFPVLSEDFILNEYFSDNPPSGSLFKLCKDQSIDIDGHNTIIPAGFMLTPFLRLRPLLSRLFGHYGYSIVEWGPLDCSPYRDMVLLNCNYDSIANGYIIPVQLAPDCSVSELLTAVENKFMARFVVLDATKQVRFIHFDALLSSENTDLSDRVAGENSYSFPEKPKRVELKSSSYISPKFSTSINQESYQQIENLAELLRKSRGLCIDLKTATLYRFLLTREMSGELLAIGSLVADYSNPAKDYEAEVISCPDVVPALQYSSVVPGHAILQLGRGRWLNSFCLLENGEKGDEDKGAELPIMFALPYFRDGLRFGGLITEEGSLLYNGNLGLFDTFYKKYDEYLRRGLIRSELPVLLRSADKMALSAVEPIVVSGNRYLPDVIGYTTQSNTVSTIKLRSLSLRKKIIPIDIGQSSFSVDRAIIDLPVHTWKVELRWRYSFEFSLGGSRVLFYENMPVSENTHVLVGVDAPDAASVDIFHWTQAANQLYDAFKKRGDRIVDPPSDEQVQSGEAYIYAASIYDTGNSSMPQHTPSPGGELSPTDPPSPLTARYLIVQLCLRAREI